MTRWSCGCVRWLHWWPREDNGRNSGPYLHPAGSTGSASSQPTRHFTSSKRYRLRRGGAWRRGQVRARDLRLSRRSVFARLLDKYFQGEPDPLTLELLGATT